MFKFWQLWFSNFSDPNIILSISQFLSSRLLAATRPIQPVNAICQVGFFLSLSWEAKSELSLPGNKTLIFFSKDSIRIYSYTQQYATVVPPNSWLIDLRKKCQFVNSGIKQLNNSSKPFWPFVENVRYWIFYHFSISQLCFDLISTWWNYLAM